MKKLTLKNLTLMGLLFSLIAPLTGIAASVESDVKSYLDEKKPRTLDEYPPVFEYVYDVYAPVIKESTQVTVLYYFTEADKPKIDDVIVLTNQAVKSAILQADAELAAAKAKGEDAEDRRGFYITDAVCGAFKGALGSAYKQTTAAWKAVEGGMQASLKAGVEPSFAATVVSRGIDTCLNEKLKYEVWLYVQRALDDTLVGTGVAYSYLAPTGAYALPPHINGEIFNYPRPDTPVCVSNCL